MQQGNSEVASTSHFSATMAQEYCSSTGASSGNETALTICSANTGWIIDSGATNHMTPNYNIFTHKHPLPSDKRRNVQLPNGETNQITHIGSCNITPQKTLRTVFLIT